MKLIYNTISRLRVPLLIIILLVSVLHYNSVSAKVEVVDAIEHIEIYTGEEPAELQEIMPNVQDKLLNIEGHLHTDDEYIDTEVLDDNRNHL